MTAYAVLVLVVSWGGLLCLALPHGMPAPREVFLTSWATVFLPYLCGPLAAGLALTGLVDGRAGYRTLARRALRWRVGWRPWAIAVGLAPTLLAGVLAALWPIWPEFRPAILAAPDPVGLLGMALAVGVFGGGLLEEPGWTGFVTDLLRRRQTVARSGALLGLGWGVWHLLPTYWASGDALGRLDVQLLLPPVVFYLGVLPPYRVLMVWVFARTDSLAVVAGMHAALTASSLFALAPAATGGALAGYYGVLTVLLWALTLITRRQPATR